MGVYVELVKLGVQTVHVWKLGVQILVPLIKIKNFLFMQLSMILDYQYLALAHAPDYARTFCRALALVARPVVRCAAFWPTSVLSSSKQPRECFCCSQ